MIQVAEAGRGDGGVGNGAALDNGDAGAENGVCLHVVRRTVNGVEEPGPSALRDRPAPLLGQDGIFGVAFLYSVHHQLLAKEVYLGHEILGGFLPYFARILVARELKLPRPAGHVTDESVELFRGVLGGPDLGRGSLVEVLAQVLGAALLAEQIQGLHLDLAYPLARDVELAAHLFEGARTVVLHPKPELDDLTLPLRQLVESFSEMGLEQRLRDGVCGGYRAGVLQEVAELGGVVVPDGRGETYGTLADLLQPLDLRHENA